MKSKQNKVLTQVVRDAIFSHFTPNFLNSQLEWVKTELKNVTSSAFTFIYIKKFPRALPL